jgi:dihydroxyacetone kinase-like protein
MVLTKKDFLKMLVGASDALDKKIDEFSDIDSKFGDGDHGVTVAKISKAIRAKAESTTDEESISEMFEALSKDIMNVQGGSAGPLYGTIVEGFGEGLEGLEEVDEAGIKAMFAGGLENIGFISTAKVGDKTLMDTLIPATKRAQESEAKLPELFADIADAAHEGAEYSKKCQAKFGRARFHKEATIGTMDAGAYSLYVLIKGFSDSFNS